MDNIQVSENIREDLKAFTDALKNSKEYLDIKSTDLQSLDFFGLTFGGRYIDFNRHLPC